MPNCGKCNDMGDRRCPDCDDDGNVCHGALLVVCPTCKGAKQITCDCQTPKCKVCNDTGWRSCEECGGSGHRGVPGGGKRDCSHCDEGKVPCECKEKQE